MASALRHNCYTDLVNADKDLTPRLLVVGGTSSLAPGIFKLAVESGYEIFATHRHQLPPDTDIAVTWFYLDIESKDSVDAFLSRLHNLSFSRIIFLAGATFGRVGHEISTDDLSEYLRIQLINPVYLIGKLIHHLEVSTSSNMIYMSSRAASFGSADWPYGIAKAGIQNYISSLSQSQKPPVSILSVVSGLILDSKMQKRMSSDTLYSHVKRAHAVGGKLLTLNEITQHIWELDPDSTSCLQGTVLPLGPVY